MRIEPPRSLPSASATMPEATAAALPPDEPPAESRGSQGLRVAPKRAFSVTGRSPSSGVFVLPTTIAPASRSRRTWALSWSATQSPNARLPSLVGSPSVAESRSLMPIGTPQSGRWSPARTPSASASARSAQTGDERVQLAGRGARSRASEASTSSRAEISPERTSRRLLDGAQRRGRLRLPSDVNPGGRWSRCRTDRLRVRARRLWRGLRLRSLPSPPRVAGAIRSLRRPAVRCACVPVPNSPGGRYVSLRPCRARAPKRSPRRARFGQRHRSCRRCSRRDARPCVR